MIYLALCFCIGALAVSFWSWMRTYGKLLETRRERDDARELRRHAVDEIQKLEIQLNHVRLQRNSFFLETERGRQASSDYRKRWN